MKRTLLTVPLLSFCLTTFAQTLSVEKVIQNVMEHYPSVKTASLQVYRAKQEMFKVQSQLGWQLGAQAGINRDVSIFGTVTDIYNIGGNMARQLESGSEVSISADISHEDAETAFSPSIANPVTKTKLDLSFRQPLEKGKENILYKQRLIGAEAGVMQANAEKRRLYEQLAEQVMDLYFAAATTQVRMANSKQAIQRSKRLYAYNKDRASLGVSEDKDLLQVEAQLKSREAEYQALLMQWQQQQVALNRLMGRPWAAELDTSVSSPKVSVADFSLLFDKIQQQSPALEAIDARIKLADTVIESSKDARKDKLDLVLFAGGRNNQGDTASASIDNSEIVGGARIEYNQAADKRGFDAEYYQAKIDRQIAIQDRLQTKEDLQYELASLLAEYKAGDKALSAYKTSVKSEKNKLNEASDRYRRGRSDTDQLIQFESHLSNAELLRDMQKIELTRRYYKLNLLTGEVWDGIQVNEITAPEFNQVELQPQEIQE